MALLCYKPGELFQRRAMLTKAVNPSQNYGNSLAAGIEHSPDDVIVYPEVFSRALRDHFSAEGNRVGKVPGTQGIACVTDGESLDQNLISQAINRNEKLPIDQRLRRKRRRNWHGHPKP